MASAKNRVIAGCYVGERVSVTLGNPFMMGVILDKNVVRNYELVTDEHRLSAASGVARGLVGGALLGPVGLLAGGLSAKSKGIYLIAVEFVDGTRSLIEADDKFYKALVKKCF